MKKLTITFESGKEVRYYGDTMTLLSYRMRIAENLERRAKLGMSVDKVLKVEYGEYDL